MGRTREKVAVGVFVGGAATYLLYTSFSAKRLPEVPAALVGTWSSECLPKGGAHPSAHVMHVTLEAGSSFKSTYVYYQDEACTKPDMVTEYTGALSIYEPNGAGLHDISWGITTVNHTAVSPRAADVATKHQLYGISPWLPGRTVELNSHAKRSYDIVQLKGDKLHFGDSRTGDQSSPSERPERLEPQGYTRVETVPTIRELQIATASPCAQAAARVLRQLAPTQAKLRALPRDKKSEAKREKLKAVIVRNGTAVRSADKCLRTRCNKFNERLACEMSQEFQSLMVALPWGDQRRPQTRDSRSYYRSH